MSLILSKGSTSKAELRLAQAISEFQKDLSTEQKAAFRTTRDSSTRTPPDYWDVMRLTEEIDRNAARKSRRCFGPRFTNVLHAIQQFAALGDVIVGGSQNILACSVWSLVRMMLLTVVNFSSYFEKMSALLMNIGRSAPRYEMLHQLYPRSKALRSHLAEYFIVVVRLCHQFLKMTKKSTLGQLITFPSDADMKAYQSELEGVSALIKEEVTLLMGQEVREQNLRIKTLLRPTEAEAQRQRLDTYVRVLDACSTYDYETTWKETRKLGTTTWFQQTTEYRHWRSSTGSATLVCTGKLGSGKSVLVANLIADLNLEVQTANCSVAYFFCRHDISDSLMAGTVIQSLGRQILRSIPDLTLVDERFKRHSVIDSGLILSVLLSLPPTFEAYFVLDGLDECYELQRRLLMKQLRGLQGAFKLRICVACRSDIGSLPALILESFAKCSIMALPEENPEIKRFIETELYACIESGRLEVGDPQLSLEIADALLAGAQGMFLWVALQIEALCAERTDEAIRRALIELPNTLQETFSRILTRSGQLQTGKHYQKRTFELVIAARRPLTTDELREALSVIPGDDVWNPARHINNVFSVLACCGSLIMVDEENLTVRLIHHSVKQFLLTSGDSSLAGGITSFDAANRAMRVTVLTYLNYGVFDTQLSTAVTPSISAQDAPSKIIRSMETPSASRTVALMLLRARNQPSVDIGKVVSETMKHRNPQNSDGFKFYSYAKSFWLQHAWFISEQSEKIAYGMLLKVISQFLSSSGSTDNERYKMLFWAAQYGHPHVLRLCVDSGLNIETREMEERTTPLFSAAANGRAAVIKMLADQGANLEFTDGRGRTALLLAAERGLDVSVRALIDCGADMEAKVAMGTPLSLAAHAGHESVIRILAEKGADLEAIGTNGDVKTPLLWAVDRKHSAIVNILLENGADPKKQSRGWTLLYTAIWSDDLHTAKILLEHGFDPNAKNARSNMTALHVAVQGANERMIRLLLDHGADVNSRDEGGRTPLVATVAAGLPIQYEAVIKILLEGGLDVNSKDDEGRTAVWHAARYEEEGCVRMLVENGADRRLMTVNGETAFSFGRNPGHVQKLQILLDNGFDIELKDGLGRTPLADAAINDDVEVVKMLLQHGANPQSRDNEGMTPITLAKDPEVLALLLNACDDVDGVVVVSESLVRRNVEMVVGP